MANDIGKTVLIILAFVFYGLGVMLSLALPFVGIIPIFGDAVSAGGAVLEEFLQFLAVIILFMVGIRK